MSQRVEVDGLNFDLPDGWYVCRPGDCAFYINSFQTFAGASKEMDLVAYDPESKVIWMIEAKDYSWFGRSKELPLDDEIVYKVRDTSALLIAAGAQDVSDASKSGLGLRSFWKHASRFSQVRIVLHLELPPSPSKLHPGVKLVTDLQTKLRKRLRPFDPRVLVSSRATPNGVPWAVDRVAP